MHVQGDLGLSHLGRRGRVLHGYVCSAEERVTRTRGKDKCTRKRHVLVFRRVHRKRIALVKGWDQIQSESDPFNHRRYKQIRSESENSQLLSERSAFSQTQTGSAYTFGGRKSAQINFWVIL
ncbi:hypothetical protein PI125_g16562 [Phytophthora idaei]|nr:hypothetical protein PI125_g16562 [Phytophthora idaei]